VTRHGAPGELLEVDLAVAVAVSLIDHLLQLLVRHVLPQLPVTAEQPAFRPMQACSRSASS